MANQQKMGLVSRVNKLWGDHEKQGVYALTLLDKAISNTKNNRDWDALAWYLSGAMKAGHGALVKAVIRMAFGERVKLDLAKGKSHPSGFAFKMTWEKDDQIVLGNSYTVVARAIEEGDSFFSASFHNKVKKATTPEKVKKTEDEQSKAFFDALSARVLKEHERTGEDMATLATKILNAAKELEKAKALKAKK